MYRGFFFRKVRATKIAHREHVVPINSIIDGHTETAADYMHLRETCTRQGAGAVQAIRQSRVKVTCTSLPTVHP